MQSPREQIDQAFAHGRYHEAETLLRQALALVETGGLESAFLLVYLGVVHKAQGRYPEARRVYEQARAILVPALGADHLGVASLYHNLGGIEHACGQYAQGEPFARRSVAIRERELGPDHPEVAADVAALAALLDGQGKYDEAEALYRRALAVFESAFGPEHYEVAVNLNNLAAIHQARGDFAGAEPLYQRGLAIKEKLLGPNHPDVAVTLNNLGTLYRKQSRYAEAEPLYRRSILILESALGREHPWSVSAQENLARLQRTRLEKNVAAMQPLTLHTGGLRPPLADRLARLLAGSWRPSPDPLHLDEPRPSGSGTTLPNGRGSDPLIPLLRQFGLEGLAWRRLRESRSPLVRKLQNAYRQQILEMANLEETILQVVADLRSAGIEPILIKGWSAARNYADPALRPYGDIDLCVAPEQFELAMKCLAERKESSHLVDLHQGVPDLRDRTWQQVFKRSQLVPLGNAEIRILGAEDHLRLLCLHCMRHGGARPLWLCDIAAALEALPADFDWNYCLSGKRSRSDWVRVAIGLPVRLLDARFSDASRKRCDAAPDWVEKTVLGRWISDTRPPSRFYEASLNFMQQLAPDDPNPIRALQYLGLSPQTQIPLLLVQFIFFFVRTVPKCVRLFRRRRQSHTGRLSCSIHRSRRFLGGAFDMISERRLRRNMRCKDAA